MAPPQKSSLPKQARQCSSKFPLFHQVPSFYLFSLCLGSLHFPSVSLIVPRFSPNSLGFLAFIFAQVVSIFPMFNNVPEFSSMFIWACPFSGDRSMVLFLVPLAQNGPQTKRRVAHLLCPRRIDRLTPGFPLSCWCSAGNEGMTLINHPLWFALRGPCGFIPIFQNFGLPFLFMAPFWVILKSVQAPHGIESTFERASELGVVKHRVPPKWVARW